MNKSIPLSDTIQKNDCWLKHWVTHENRNSSEYLKWQKPSLEKGCFTFASVLCLASVPWLEHMNKDLKLILQPLRGNKGSGISVLGNSLVFIYSTVKGHVVLESDFLWICGKSPIHFFSIVTAMYEPVLTMPTAEDTWNEKVLNANIERVAANAPSTVLLRHSLYCGNSVKFKLFEWIFSSAQNKHGYIV